VQTAEPPDVLREHPTVEQVYPLMMVKLSSPAMQASTFVPYNMHTKEALLSAISLAVVQEEGSVNARSISIGVSTAPESIHE
jgi:hypothetical protein